MNQEEETTLEFSTNNPISSYIWDKYDCNGLVMVKVRQVGKGKFQF
jgi:hypothetical protein